jgi:hypothetical protein
MPRGKSTNATTTRTYTRRKRQYTRHRVTVADTVEQLLARAYAAGFTAARTLDRAAKTVR